MDPDAAVYITAVEQADGQSLEETTQRAIDNFVLGCKSDAIWDAIKASCILAGARTLNGALIPLKGTAPTNFNFVSGDYNRKTGLVGNGSTKYLNTNRNNNADPQNNKHLAVYKSQTSYPSDNNAYIGFESIVGSYLMHNQNGTSANLNTSVLSSPPDVTIGGTTTGTFLIGISRSNSANVVTRFNGANTTRTLSSSSPSSGSINVFRMSSTTYLDNVVRIMFYSIGVSIDLARLDTRVTTLINAISAAIP